MRVVIAAGIGALASAALPGCAGDKDRDIPLFEDGILQVGDCDAPVDSTDSILVEELYRGINTGFDLSRRELPGEYAIFSEQQPYLDFMGSIGFGTAPITDWNLKQVAAVWYDVPSSCNVIIESYQIKELSEGGVMVDLELFDESLNCTDTCGERQQVLLLVAFDGGQPGKVCRRVVPGCAAP
jgi:hypothetical protein